VLAVERAYVASATGGSVATGVDPDRKRALAALGAIASRYLAVGTPRSIGLVVDDPIDAELSLEAHRTWFQPRDIRIAGSANTSLADALASDIVCIYTPIAIAASQLRRGTHVNVLGRATLDDDLQRLATLVHETPGLGALAAGLVDGRQLDELTVFVAGDAAVALAAL
jgi:ornithine cyclodeaminase/alanine dehydrogenase-like protein (mu-crystallin family)